MGWRNGRAKKAFHLSLELWSPRGMPLTACSMFTRSFVLQTGIWLISELVVHARIPVTIPFRLPLYLPFFLPFLYPLHASVSTSASVFLPTCFSIRAFARPLPHEKRDLSGGIYRTRSRVHANVYSLRKIRDNIAPRFAAPEILRCVIQLLIEIFFFFWKNYPVK